MLLVKNKIISFVKIHTCGPHLRPTIGWHFQRTSSNAIGCNFKWKFTTHFTADIETNKVYSLTITAVMCNCMDRHTHTHTHLHTDIGAQSNEVTSWQWPRCNCCVACQSKSLLKYILLARNKCRQTMIVNPTQLSNSPTPRLWSTPLQAQTKMAVALLVITRIAQWSHLVWCHVL